MDYFFYTFNGEFDTVRICYVFYYGIGLKVTFLFFIKGESLALSLGNFELVGTMINLEQAITFGFYYSSYTGTFDSPPFILFSGKSCLISSKEPTDNVYEMHSLIGLISSICILLKYALGLSL